MNNMIGLLDQMGLVRHEIYLLDLPTPLTESPDPWYRRCLRGNSR